MATDEAILRASKGSHIMPTLRLYAWEPSAVSLGYFQNFTEDVCYENCQKYGFDIVRRPTGGKAVLHQSDLTYSFVADKNCRLFPDNVLGTYEVISSCLKLFFSKIGVPVTAAGPGIKPGRTTWPLSAFRGLQIMKFWPGGKKTVEALKSAPGMLSYSMEHY